MSAFVIIAVNASFAQIGYQVSLLNNATGEPRANETVAVTVEITNSEGGTVCSETKTETTNDFGVLSMTVGSDAVFAKTDWSKLPFYISATVDGILIGRSQLLSVPVAECAKTVKSCKDILMSKTWTGHANGSDGYPSTLSFSSEYMTQTITRTHEGKPATESYKYKYATYGNVIVGGGEGCPFIYDPTKEQIIGKYNTYYN